MTMKTFLVWCPDLGSTKEDSRGIEALDEELAVLEWAEREDFSSAEYEIVGRAEREVIVVEDRDGAEEFRFSVTGRPVPQYYARRVEQKP